MKSLYLINNNIQKHEYYDYDTNEKLMWYEVSLKEEELNKLKQDLEVLEIIKKCRFVRYHKFVGNAIIIDNITDEQYQKIREWEVEQDEN